MPLEAGDTITKLQGEKTIDKEDKTLYEVLSVDGDQASLDGFTVTLKNDQIQPA